MKIYDFFTFFDEKMLLNFRLNYLDKFVDKFVIAEAAYTHSGNKKKINFNINDYPKFKHKIIRVEHTTTWTLVVRFNKKLVVISQIILINF